ncbi:MAG: hypothetical protein HC934_02100 [Acaryochloridaceae cyanobacterium SU_2_1]|nr:hypothetical protein [Acaryochloridaceae cyanobacterium SU_2_1]
MQDGVSNLETTLAWLPSARPLSTFGLEDCLESHPFNLADFLETEESRELSRQQVAPSFAADQLMNLSPSQVWQFAWLGILAPMRSLQLVRQQLSGSLCLIKLGGSWIYWLISNC